MPIQRSSRPLPFPHPLHLFPVHNHIRELFHITHPSLPLPLPHHHQCPFHIQPILHLLPFTFIPYPLNVVLAPLSSERTNGMGTLFDFDIRIPSTLRFYHLTFFPPRCRCCSIPAACYGSGVRRRAFFLSLISK